jgi:hypothetical protein
MTAAAKEPHTVRLDTSCDFKHMGSSRSGPYERALQACLANRRGLADDSGTRDQKTQGVMKALALYVGFVTVGAIISGAIGLYVESAVSSAASLVVFLILFFANFVVSWIAVILIIDGNLKDAQGRQAQAEVERAGRAQVNARSSAPSASS